MVDMASTLRVCSAFLLAFAAASLGGCDNGSTAASGASTTASGASGAGETSGALMISGSPASSAVVGAPYSFHPTVTAPAGVVLTYVVSNLPGWATFDSTTGSLSGTPTAADVGTSAPILIMVSDGNAAASLSQFSVEVTQSRSGEADLSWTVPSQAANATSAELAGYHIYYGTSSTDLTHVVDVSNPGSTSYVINNLSAGTWYFAIKSYDTNSVESSSSAVVPVQI
jgi:hypothetical protein